MSLRPIDTNHHEKRFPPFGASSHVTVRPTESQSIQLNCWIAPGFDPLKMVEHFSRQINSGGGNIEQSYMYLDHKSAIDWDAIVSQTDYISAEQDFPIDQATSAVIEQLSMHDLPHSLEIVALGPGTAQKEIRFVKALADKLPNKVGLRMCLLDISQPLLSTAYRLASQVFGYDQRVFAFAVQGNMHDLPTYDWLMYTNPALPTPRLITMFGYTFGNLDNEIRFVRDTLRGLQRNDMLLIDFGVTTTPSADAEAIHRNDPYLSGSQKWRIDVVERFILGPLHRYRQDLESAAFYPVLDNKTCVVPGSYSIDMQASVSTKQGTQHHYTMHRVKRYDCNQLVRAISETNVWDYVQGWKFGHAQDRVLYLFKKI